MRMEDWAREFLLESRLAHLATSTKNGKPQVIPICYVYDGDSLYSSIDEKPKRRSPTQLQRVLNIVENPSVSLVVDRYEEDWSKLKYVLVRGSAEIVHTGEEHEHAVQLLREKYAQYRQMKLEERPVIRIRPISVFAWSTIIVKSRPA
ncbi:MAG: TIGR03668 family PPOX class F420-dependent oxidoreductase [Candidatus Bathyarchaeia archaeon]|jgi:coenzyme F420-0:L-glutamate ligase/coenzyme F420-1:gamma-L-glutamate ligase